MCCSKKCKTHKMPPVLPCLFGDKMLSLRVKTRVMRLARYRGQQSSSSHASMVFDALSAKII